MPPDDFKPSGAFEGYVFAKLENIEKRVDNLPCPDNNKRINKCETDISNIRGQAAMLGATAGIFAGLIITAFQWVLAKI